MFAPVVASFLGQSRHLFSENLDGTWLVSRAEILAAWKEYLDQSREGCQWQRAQDGIWNGEG